MEKDFSFITPEMDLNSVDPIHQKRLLAFVNFWLTQMFNLLNNFALAAETKVNSVEQRLDAIETSLTLLEMKLASIPGTEFAQATKHRAQLDSTPNSLTPVVDLKTGIPPPPPPPPPLASQFVSVSLVKVVEEVKPVESVDPELEKFVKMKAFGVPVDAIKLKMKAEGLDPSLLDTLAQATPQKPTAKPAKTHHSSGDSDSDVSSFTDDD